ncbi:PINc/VapC family ATPase [Methanobrevibacter sp. OttesenSCG-928-K11]|nr:PINc/VapC family ATPase [Methanobrevibacter sp. OttesenSCG-928-K11]MDL2271110.1 PINc/VapC family ATPase [Methanobrevibacter sp. OttesenSCG-928-I08]
MLEKNLKTIVPDTSAIIEGVISQIIEENDLDYPEIIVPEAVISELEHQANIGKSIGFKGLNELQYLQKLEYDGKIAVSFKGDRPKNYEIDNAKKGEIDALIRRLAKSELATLITCDKIQAEASRAQGLNVLYYQQKIELKDLSISEYFDEETLSIHLKENVVPMAKKGAPGHIELVEIGDDPCTIEYLEDVTEEILTKERYDPKTYLESEKIGSLVIQSREYRISIAKPPFSEGYEITAVKPVVKIPLEEYNLSDKLFDRLKNNAEGILISGSPGAGKSTFVQAIGEFYSEDLKKIVKTMESPRDLQVSDEITQYSPLEGDMENTADVLLLVRPDFTIYDELRKSSDFRIFADMRLSGVGMIGVVHSTKPIDAIQRIASRVELGVIPSVVDTSIYIEDGKIKDVYEVNMTVKVPSGMQEADLARPVIEVRDFETGELKNEIYTYGEQTIVMDLDLVSSSSSESSKSSVDKIAEKSILKILKKIIPKSKIDVEVISPNRANIYVNEKLIPKVIGQNGKRIAEIEKEVGISLGVEAIKEKKEHKAQGKKFEVEVIETKKQVILDIGKANSGDNFDVYVDDDYLLTATTSRNGEIKIKKGVELSEIILEAVDMDLEISAIKK